MYENRIFKSIFSGPFLLPVLLLFLSSTVAGLGTVVWRDYWYSREHNTWDGARSHCKRSFHDLATIYTESDGGRLKMDSHWAWTGLYRRTTDSSSDAWYWSHNEEHGFWDTKWAQNEPSAGEDCSIALYSHKKIYGTSCHNSYFFICHKYYGPIIKYKFIPQSMKWSDAQDYCRTKYDDLAYIPTSETDSAIEKENFPVWIGLHKDGSTWAWISGTSDYSKWGSGGLGDVDGDGDADGECAAISSVSKEMYTLNCAKRLPFACMKDNLLVVKEKKTWENALEHCRRITAPNLRYELISVQPEDYNFVMGRVFEADTEEVWTGLRFLAGSWLWVNGADMTFSGLPLCPVNLQHCGSLSKNYSGGFETRDCTEKKNFVCYSR